MKNFFKNFGNFITVCEEYFDNRIRTGKFVEDIRGLLLAIHNLTWKKFISTIITISKSKQYQAFLQKVRIIWHMLLRIPLLGIFLVILSDGIVMFIKFYADFFLIFAVTFPTIILLLNFFENATLLFFISFLPIFFFNIYAIAALYYCIDKRKQGEVISLRSSFKRLFRQTGSFIFTFLFHLAVIMEISIGFAILTLFFSYFFDAINLAWSGSFTYWFFVIFVGLLLFIGIAVLSTIIQQAYFVMVFEQKKLSVAFKNGWRIIASFPVEYIFLYFIVYSVFGYILYWATLYYLYVGIAIGLYFFIQKNYFLGFLLYKRYRSQTVLPQIPTEEKTSPVFAIITIFGIFNYILIAGLITKQYQSVNAQIEQARNDYFLSRQLNQYTNSTYHYVISYPQNWTRYEWHSNSVTFYNNYTATITGGTWLNIAVTPYSDSEFKKLYLSEPGLISYETQTKDIITKVTNISVQGYQGVNYTYTKSGQPYDQHQTHYLIHKDNSLYDIQFITLSNDTSDTNNDLFDKIFQSFQFMK